MKKDAIGKKIKTISSSNTGCSGLHMTAYDEKKLQTISPKCRYE